MSHGSGRCIYWLGFVDMKLDCHLMAGECEVGNIASSETESVCDYRAPRLAVLPNLTECIKPSEQASFNLCLRPAPEAVAYTIWPWDHAGGQRTNVRKDTITFTPVREELR